MAEVAQVVGACASLLTAIAVIIGFAGIARRADKLDKSLDRVHSEVKTGNGKTIAMLADATEGRRVRSDVPVGERTESEQHYVDSLGPDDEN